MNLSRWLYKWHTFFLGFMRLSIKGKNIVDIVSKSRANCAMFFPNRTTIHHFDIVWSCHQSVFVKVREAMELLSLKKIRTGCKF